MSRKIVITGASSAMGNAIAEMIIGAEDTAVLQYHTNKEPLTRYESHDGVQLVSADFTQSDDIHAFSEYLKDTDIFIHCAAQVKTGLLVSMDEQECMDMITANQLSTILLCQKIIPAMTAKRSGSIVLISSVAAQKGNRGQAVYAGTKGFTESFMRSIAAEYGGKGIRINCVAPGPMEEGSVSDLLSYAKEQVVQSTVLRKLGTAQDVAGMVTFLCSEQAGFITGKVFGVDGGFQQGV